MSLGCGSKKWYHNCILVNGSKDKNPCNGSALILSHTHSVVGGWWTMCGASTLNDVLRYLSIEMATTWELRTFSGSTALSWDDSHERHLE